MRYSGAKRDTVSAKAGHQMGQLAFYAQDLALVRRAIAWHWRNVWSTNPRPLIAGVYLTNECPLRCVMCSLWRSQPKQRLAIATLRGFLDAAGSTLAYLSFSGGEPLTHPELVAAIRLAADRVPRVHLVTHGSGLTANQLRELAAAGLNEISFSLEGDRDWHNRVRGSADAYDEAQRAITLTRATVPGLPMVINTVIFPGRLDQARIAIEWAGRAGLRQRVQPVNPHFDLSGAITPAPDLSAADPLQVADFVRFCRGQRHLLSSRYFLARMEDYFRGSLLCELSRPRCRVPRFFVELTPTGTVSPCLFGSGWASLPGLDPEAAATLAGASFHELQQRLAGCRRCDTAMFICCWEPPLVLFPDLWLRYGWR